MAEAWRGFKKDGHWDVDVNVRNFIQTNYTPYDGDESFLELPQLLLRMNSDYFFLASRGPPASL